MMMPERDDEQEYFARRHERMRTRETDRNDILEAYHSELIRQLDKHNATLTAALEFLRRDYNNALFEQGQEFTATLNKQSTELSEALHKQSKELTKAISDLSLKFATEIGNTNTRMADLKTTVEMEFRAHHKWLIATVLGLSAFLGYLLKALGLLS